jgi:hypothetical protein
MKVIMPNVPQIKLGTSAQAQQIEAKQLSVKDVEQLLRGQNNYVVIHSKEDLDILLYERFGFPSNINKMLWSEHIGESIQEVLVPGYNNHGSFEPLDIDNFSFDQGMKPKQFCFMHIKYV